MNIQRRVGFRKAFQVLPFGYNNSVIKYTSQDLHKYSSHYGISLYPRLLSSISEPDVDEVDSSSSSGVPVK